MKKCHYIVMHHAGQEYKMNKPASEEIIPLMNEMSRIDKESELGSGIRKDYKELISEKIQLYISKGWIVK